MKTSYSIDTSIKLFSSIKEAHKQIIKLANKLPNEIGEAIKQEAESIFKHATDLYSLNGQAYNSIEIALNMALIPYDICETKGGGEGLYMPLLDIIAFILNKAQTVQPI